MSRLTVALANLIVVLAVLPGCARSADQPLPAQLDAVFREAHADGEFSGNVLVTRGDAIVYQASFGVSRPRAEHRERRGHEVSRLLGKQADDRDPGLSAHRR